MAMANDLWRECVAWLTRCKILPVDHKANWPVSEIRVLALTLRDGVLLCNLILFLDPTCMDKGDFNRKPQMAQFLCCKNIKLFLDVCKNHFGIRESDLFEPTMLYDLTNFHRVLITLSKLSHCRKVQQLHPDIEGFNIQLSHTERSHSDEAIYKDLHSTERKTNGTTEAVTSSSSTSTTTTTTEPEPPNETENHQHELDARSSSLSVEDDNSDITVEAGNDTCFEDDSSSLNGQSSVVGSVASINSSSSSINSRLHSAAAKATIWTYTTHAGGGVDVNDIYFDEEEKVYEDLCYVTFSSNLRELTTSFEQRDYVIRELIDTESNYLDVLNALKYKFMVPMEKYLAVEDIKTIFPRIRDLAEIHSKFLDKLREAVLPNTKLKLSQVFLDFREPFLIYGEYCSNLINGIDALGDICKRNSLIEQLVQQCEKEYNVGKLQLRDILSVPMQRILKYHLLLDKLVKETSPVHEDFRGLERAKEAMVDVAQYINEVKRDSDHLVIIQKVKDSIIDIQGLKDGNDLAQYGRLLLDGELHIKAHEDQKTKLRYAFVFDKILILVKTLSSKTGDTQYTFKDSHNLADYRVEQGHSRRTLGRDTRFKYQLLLARKSQKTAFTLYLKSEPERDKWRKALSEAMENLDPPGCRTTDHKMEITTFDAPVQCTHCSKFLKGRIHQGYKCKVCEIPVHKGCISSTGRCKQNPISIPPPVCDRQLAEFNWFVGTMDRDTAASRLEGRKVGTYLLRVRPQGASNSHETMYAVSLKTDDNVIKHMKINQGTDGDHVIYCLSTRRHFKTIVELVSYYERNDLGENFAGLNQSLLWPFREVIATAIYEFEPKGTNQLQLKQGCQVVVIGKDGDSKGWWRGRIGETVGYFPKEYVKEHPTTTDDL
ncbi:protein vav isoform X1 [Episyrphus balteatus]|uniref:protein vav isoform X1 n=1 Tax=Episyrphus balteatus TaxID=286459 RepID=UPI002485B988|nr:protein vav isoform X1 [Episyrphus balteatus]